MQRTYCAHQTDTTDCYAWVEDKGHAHPLEELRYDYRAQQFLPGDNGGFAFSYSGTGPHNLARAIVADACGLNVVNAPGGNALVHEFCWSRVARAPKSGLWRVTADEVRAFADRWVSAHPHEIEEYA